MKLITSSFITLFLCILISNFAVAQQQIKVPLSKPRKPGKLSLSLTQGSVTVSAYDGEKVIINYNGDKPRRKLNKATKDGLHRISSNNNGLQVKENNNHVTISGITMLKNKDFNILVPSNFSLDLSSLNGDISVEGLSGEFDLHAVNGDITLSDAGGAAVINTVNGDIEATFKTVFPDEPMSFSTVSGDIDLTLPDNAKVSAKVKAQFGDVYTDFDMDIKHRKNKRIGKSGVYKVTVNNWIYGSINGGGPKYQLKTLRGDIYIRKE